MPTSEASREAGTRRRPPLSRLVRSSRPRKRRSARTRSTPASSSAPAAIVAGRFAEGSRDSFRRTSSERQRKTASAFGWQWQHFVEMHPEFEAQFLDWVHPIRAGVLPGKASARRGLRHRPARLLRSLVRRIRGRRARPERRRRDRSPKPRVVRQRRCRPGRSPAAAVSNGRAGRWLRPRLFDRCPAPSARPARGVPEAGRVRPARRHDRRVGLRPREQRLRPQRRRAGSARVDEAAPVRAARARVAARAGFHGVAKGVYRPLHGTAAAASAPARRAT